MEFLIDFIKLLYRKILELSIKVNFTIEIPLPSSDTNLSRKFETETLCGRATRYHQQSYYLWTICFDHKLLAIEIDILYVDCRLSLYSDIVDDKPYFDQRRQWSTTMQTITNNLQPKKPISTKRKISRVN